MDTEKEPKTNNLEKSVVSIIEKMVHYIDKQDSEEEEE